VLSPQGRLTLQNAENIANTTQTFVVCFFAFLAFMVSLRLFLQNFTGHLTSWLCLCSPVHRNQRHKPKEITNTAYTQTKTTTSTVVGVFLQLHHPNNNHSSNINNKSNNNKKLLLQI
jgi:hypothetical protein